MVGQDQAIRRYKGSAGAANPDAALLEMLQPIGCRGEVIFFLELLNRQIVEEPKAFIRGQAARQEGSD
jgi:hypothetical protein